MSATLSLLRVIGYTTSIVLHWGNIFYLSRTDFNSYENKDIRTFGALQYRYLTCWTFFLQSVHALLGLICEYLLFKNGKRKDYKLPKYLRGARDTLFSAIVFPSTFLVATVFWSLYHYDKTVILPSYVFEFLTPTSNHIMHTWIVPLSLWEVFCQPRYIPRSHVRNISHLAFHMVLYLSVLVYTYYEKDYWLYPIFGMIFGTMYFYILVVVITLVTFFYYYLQWSLVKCIWGSKTYEKTKKLR